VERLEVTWPDGAREVFPVPGVDRLLTLERGRGEPAAGPAAQASSAGTGR